jgi:hypothetical protein
MARFKMVTEYYSNHMQLSVYITTVAGMGNKTTYQDKDQSALFCVSSNSFYCHLCRLILTNLKNPFVHKATELPHIHWPLGYTFLGLGQVVSLLQRLHNYVQHSTKGWVWTGRKWSRIILRCYTSICLGEMREATKSCYISLCISSESNQDS